MADRLSILSIHISPPAAPIHYYRGLSTINKEALKKVIYKSYAEIRDKYFSYIISDPLFTHHTSLELNRDQQREVAFKQMVKYFRKTGITFAQYELDPMIASIAGDCMFSFDAAAATKSGVHFVLYTFSLFALGTKKHIKFIDRAMNLVDIGSFALTELSHGSNARDIQTTAHYDSRTEEFILNSPNELAMKFWIGAVADIANMTLVWAQLIINDKNYGPHVFLVPIRDLKDHSSMTGVLIGDCGAKNGCNGIDNGFLIFKNCRIPRDNLLDKYSQVMSDGTFITDIPNPDKRFGIQLGSLAGGRLNLALNSTSQLTNAITIGVRFAVGRKQFGIPGKEEQSIIEYQLVQNALMPITAGAVVFKIAAVHLVEIWGRNKEILLNDHKNPLIAEFHALASALKALSTWNAVKGIQKCREICGGLGYSAYNRLGAILADTDVTQTFEGENSVLIQQTAKFLIDVVRDKLKGKERNYESIKWMEEGGESIEGNWLDEKNVRKAMEYRCNASLQESGLKLQENVSKLGEQFTAWNETQVFYLQNLSKAYGELWCFNESLKAINQCTCDKTKIVLNKLVILWGLTKLQDDISTLRDNDYISNTQSKDLREKILLLCKELKTEVVGIIDAIAPPEDIIGAPIAVENGDIYGKLLNTIISAPSCFEKVKWWKDIHGN